MSHAPDIQKNPARVLIVDDELHNRQLLEVMLAPEGLLLQTASSGEEALELVAHEPPDLILLDVMMPGLSGYQVAARIKGDLATKNIPIILVTALDDREARMLGLDAGAEDFLTKPVDRAELCARVRNLLRLKAYSDHLDHYSRLLEGEVDSLGSDLFESESLYRSTFDAAPVGIAHVGLGGQWLRVNQRLCQMLGYTRQGLQGIAARELMPSDAVAREAEMFRQMVAGTLDRHVVEDQQYRRQDGTLMWARVHTSVHRDDEGRARHFISVIEDITEKKALGAHVQVAESAMRYERDRAQQYLDSAQVILLALDAQGRVTLANRYACSLLGWTEDQLLGRDWVQACIPERMRDVVGGVFREVIGGSLDTVENLVLTRSGEERLVVWHNAVLQDESGRATGTLSSGIDITQRAAAAEALQALEERMRFALQAAGVGIWDMDFSTGILDWSGIIEAQHGIPPGTFGGTFEAFVDRIHPDDRQSVLDGIRDSEKRGGDFTTGYRTIWADGTVHWLGGAGRVYLDEKGEPLRAVGISQDFTERQALEGQCLQAGKMEAVGRLASGVAHDFNNLLTVILGTCELSLDHLDPADPRRGDILVIQQAGESAAGLTGQLLAFSRKQVVQPRLLDLNHLVTGLRAMVGRLIREDVKVVLALQPDLGPVRADPGQVEQVLMNLAVNARDAMPRGGTLTIASADVRLDETSAWAHPLVKPGEYVLLSVTDTGAGMTPQVKSRLFEPLFTTKAVGQGTGLGLAIVHGLVTRSGGFIEVDSEIDRGTSFKVYWPRAEAAGVAAVAPAPILLPPTGAETVLVVEDSEGLRQVVRSLLERLGYAVLVAADAEEAVHLSEQGLSFDVLLTDVVMPGARGPELARRLAERWPRLKVVYMSGFNEEVVDRDGVLLPGIVFLPKPFTIKELGLKIREALDQ